VTVRLNTAGWPAVTVAAEGAASKEKSLPAIVMMTGADVLPANLSSPLYDAVRECAPADSVSILRMATAAPSREQFQIRVPVVKYNLSRRYSSSRLMARSMSPVSR